MIWESGPSAAALVKPIFPGFPNNFDKHAQLPVPSALITDEKALCFVLMYVTELILKTFISQLKLGDLSTYKIFSKF